jgi:hypothetical protein
MKQLTKKEETLSIKLFFNGDVRRVEILDKEGKIVFMCNGKLLPCDEYGEMWMKAGIAIQRFTGIPIVNKSGKDYILIK